MNGHYKIRFDLVDDTDYLPYLQEVSSLCDRAIFYYHPNGKTDGKLPHIHGLLVNYKKTDDTLRKNTKQLFKLTSSTSCSISNTFSKGIKMTDITYPKYLIYMTKGKYDPVFSKDFSSEEYSLAKSMWREPQSKTQEKAVIVIEPKEKVIKKLTQFQCAQEVEIRYMEEYGDDDFNLDALLEITPKVLKDNKTMAHYRLVANIIQDIQSRRDPDSFKNAVRRLLNF